MVEMRRARILLLTVPPPWEDGRCAGAVADGGRYSQEAAGLGSDDASEVERSWQGPSCLRLCRHAESMPLRNRFPGRVRNSRTLRYRHNPQMRTLSVRPTDSLSAGALQTARQSGCRPLLCSGVWAHRSSASLVVRAADRRTLLRVRVHPWFRRDACRR